MSKNASLNPLRLRPGNAQPVRDSGDYVLYWMTSARRMRYNFAVEHAVTWANNLGKPLVILEALNVDYPWACDRFHQFVWRGMCDNAAYVQQKAAHKGVTYLPYIEPKKGEGRGLLRTLCEHACVVIGDYFPASWLATMVPKVLSTVPCAAEMVDSNGILPIASSEKASPTAYVFRRFFQKNAGPFLSEFPSADPLLALKNKTPATVPRAWGKTWKATNLNRFSPADYPINHHVAAVENIGGTVGGTVGGSQAGEKILGHFIEHQLARYHTDRSVVDDGAASGLSPYLHFGHIGVHDIVARVLRHEQWAPPQLAHTASGKREGWWGLSAGSEAFLDELIIWREVGFHYCHHRPQHETFADLPTWAQESLEQHASDKRQYIYTLEQFAEGKTHDELWNAAQNELRISGKMHNYLRMLWGKKIIEWTAHPREALHIMTELNNRYALDGRDPNSSTGISWCLGRFDRPWAPQRPIFGCIRFMSSASTLKKIALKKYLARWNKGPNQHGQQLGISWAADERT
jgi:deoxyribodipyrimidine photo-lyase